MLSHLEEADASKNLPARVGAVVATSAASTHVISVDDLLDQKLNLKEWTAPRTFVLLMACDSAQKHLEDLTSLIDTFFGVGAAAVAGTECEVVSDLASDFASTIALQLVGDTKPVALGTALRAYTESMLKSRNPLPFAVSVFGSADLTVTRERSHDRRADATGCSPRLTNRPSVRRPDSRSCGCARAEAGAETVIKPWISVASQPPYLMSAERADRGPCW